MAVFNTEFEVCHNINILFMYDDLKLIAVGYITGIFFPTVIKLTQITQLNNI